MSDDVGVQLIVAGNDAEGCHLFSIFNPGLTIDNDAIGYACIGIGAPHATYYLIDSDYRKSLTVKKVEDLVRKAKVRSEKAPGVGKKNTVEFLPKVQKEVENA